MAGNYFEDQQFESIDYILKPLASGVYEGCSFINCNFADTDLSKTQFIDCNFRNCNLSMVKVIDTSFNGVGFEGCKMLGINFETCNRSLFKPVFANCVLNYSSFFQCNLKKSRFPKCVFQETDFTEADLTETVFADCDLLNAKFDRTILDKADLRSAINYSINPEINKIKKAKFSFPAVTGLLDKYDIIIES
jgi:fluoroquinolone resistance protein